MIAHKMYLLSVLLGILTSLIPNLVFSKVYWHGAKKDPRQIVRSLYWGKALNYALLICLISICLQWSKINPLVFFWSFLLFELARWIRCWFTLPRNVVNE